MKRSPKTSWARRKAFPIDSGLSNGVLEAINGNVQAAKQAKGHRTKRNPKTSSTSSLTTFSPTPQYDRGLTHLNSARSLFFALGPITTQRAKQPLANLPGCAYCCTRRNRFRPSALLNLFTTAEDFARSPFNVKGTRTFHGNFAPGRLRSRLRSVDARRFRVRNPAKKTSQNAQRRGTKTRCAEPQALLTSSCRIWRTASTFQQEALSGHNGARMLPITCVS